jgi:uncharacterized protein YcnI
MRCSGWSSLAISVSSAVALLLAGPAAAHVVATPAFLPSGSSESVTFAAPNEREVPMTSFALTVPSGVTIEHAHEVEGWEESVDGATATWQGGRLLPNREIAFGMDMRAETEPGTVEVIARQRYGDRGVVRWSVPLTVTPAAESPSENLALAGVVGLIGVLVVAAIAMVAWRRRT